MAKLTEQLISEFVQTTAPKTDDRNHEFTVTGTVISVGENGVVNVRMDGGEEAPCQATVGCAVDDRVIVSFKNREPVVTSNITSPTTSVAQLNAEVANINTVLAQKATITQLNTEVANINNVVAQKATITYVDTKTVNAVNVFAQNGTFNGTLSVNANTSKGTIAVTICSRDANARVAIPIRISEKYTGQAATEYRTTIGGDGLLLQQITSNSDIAHTDVGYGGVTVWANGVGTTSMTPLGVSGPNGSRLISSGEISKLNNYPASPPAKWNSPLAWSRREDEYAGIGAKSYKWYALTKPTNTDYNWYLINAVSDENAHWVLHTSQTGAYIYNNSSTAEGNVFITGYWLGIHK